jgi:hypothetical protein
LIVNNKYILLIYNINNMSNFPWSDTCKTTINGQDIDLGTLFHKSSDLNNGLASGAGGDNYKGDNTAFSYDNATTSGPSGKNTSFNNATYANNNATTIGNGWGFNDKAANCGYQYNGNDIGPNCVANYVDVTTSVSDIAVPAWVDYYNVIIAGRGGLSGEGRNTNDQKWEGPTGSSGGLIIWKSTTNLGAQGNKSFTINFSTTNTFFAIRNGTDSGWDSYCKSNTGIDGNHVHGNDGNDTNVNSRTAVAGGATNSSYGTKYGEFTQSGLSSNNTNYNNNTNYAHNVIADRIVGWSTAGKGSDWTSGQGSTAYNRGASAVRYYAIGYDHG